MNIDWLNVLSTLVATFVGGLAGSWFASRATHRQTQLNLQASEFQWQKERAFELIDVVDEFVNYAWRKETLTLPERDRLTRRLLVLSAIVLPEYVSEIRSQTQEVRKYHINKEHNTTFPAVEKYFNGIRQTLLKKITATFNK
jgi:hypothetical protein